ncbi:hypothetical protein [Staphylococcus sp. 11262D007BW]
MTTAATLLTGTLMHHDTDTSIAAEEDNTTEENTANNNTAEQPSEEKDVRALSDEAEGKINELDYLNTDYKNSFLELLRLNDHSETGIEDVLQAAEDANETAKKESTDNDRRPVVDAIDQQIDEMYQKVDMPQQKEQRDTLTVGKDQDNKSNTEESNTTESSETSNNTDESSSSDSTSDDGKDDFDKILDKIDSLNNFLGNDNPVNTNENNSTATNEQPTNESDAYVSPSKGEEDVSTEESTSTEAQSDNSTAPAQNDSDDSGNGGGSNDSESDDNASSEDKESTPSAPDMSTDDKTPHQEEQSAINEIAGKDPEDLSENRDTTSKIQQVITDVADRQSKDQDYTELKRNALSDLSNLTQDSSQLSDDQKQQLQDSIKEVSTQLDDQNNVIVDHLKNTDDKRQATKTIFEQLFNENEASKRLDNIDFDNQNDQQLANQIQREVGQLQGITGDSVLDGMLNNTSNQAGLIQAILASRYNTDKAKSLADTIMEGHPDNETVIERLKSHFTSDGKASSDDILKSLLNNSDHKKDIIKAILGSKLSPENADFLTDRLADDIQSGRDLLGLVRGELDDKANTLLALRGNIAQARDKASDRLSQIFSPLKGLPSLDLPSRSNSLNLPSTSTNDKLMDRLNSGSRLLGGSNGLFQNDFAPKPNIDPYELIGRDTTSGGLLDGLFDDKGNFQLPDTGTVAKYSWVPIGVVVVIVGVLFIWKSRKKHKHSS